jgi:hypothetical protein
MRAAVESAAAGKEKLARAQMGRAKSNVDLFSSVFIVLLVLWNLVVSTCSSSLALIIKP